MWEISGGNARKAFAFDLAVDGKAAMPCIMLMQAGAGQLESDLTAEFRVIEAPYGHDCFLLEEARQTPIIRQFLDQHSLAAARDSA